MSLHGNIIRSDIVLVQEIQAENERMRQVLARARKVINHCDHWEDMLKEIEAVLAEIDEVLS